MYVQCVIKSSGLETLSEGRRGGRTKRARHFTLNQPQRAHPPAVQRLNGGHPREQNGDGDVGRPDSITDPKVRMASGIERLSHSCYML